MSVIRCSHQRVSELFRCDAGHNQCGPLFRPLKTSGEQSPSDLHQTTLQTDHYRQLAALGVLGQRSVIQMGKHKVGRVYTHLQTRLGRGRAG